MQPLINKVIQSQNIITTIVPSNISLPAELSPLPAQPSSDSLGNDDILPEHRYCEELLSLGLVNEEYAFIREPDIHKIPAPTPHCIEALQQQMNSELYFYFFKDDPQNCYKLTKRYDALNLKFARAREKKIPIKNISLFGSKTCEIIGTLWGKALLANQNRSLEPLIEAIDLSHIENDVHDVDTIIDARVELSVQAESSSEDINLHEVLMLDLIKEHHQILQIKILFNDGSYFEMKGFESVVLYLADPKNRYRKDASISGFEVVGHEIPWLHGVKQYGGHLQDFYSDIHIANLNEHMENPILLDGIINHLAYIYIFQKPKEEMINFIMAKSSSHFSIIYKHKFINNQLTVIKNWLLVTCQSSNGLQDLVLVQERKTPTARTEFQKIRIDILPNLMGSKEIHIIADRQSILDKYCRLIRWVDIKHANHIDWGQYWLWMAKGYRCVLPDTEKELLGKFLTYCDFTQQITTAFSTVIKERLGEPSKSKPTLKFAFIFGALSSIPKERLTDKDILSILQLCKDYFDENLPKALTFILEAISNSTLTYNIVRDYLQTLSLKILLVPVAQRGNSILRPYLFRTPGRQFIIETHIHGYTLKSPFTPCKTLQTYFESYTAFHQSNNQPAFEALLKIASDLIPIDPYKFDFHTYNHRKIAENSNELNSLKALAGKVLRSPIPHLRKEGYSLLLLYDHLNPSIETLQNLIINLSIIFKEEKNPVYRQTIAIHIQKALDYRLNLATVEKKTISIYFNHLIANVDLDDKSIHLNLIRVCHIINQKGILNRAIVFFWSSLEHCLTIQELQHLGFYLLKDIPLSSKIILIIQKTLLSKKAASSQQWKQQIEIFKLKALKKVNPNKQLQHFFSLFEVVRYFLANFSSEKKSMELEIFEWTLQLCDQKKVNIAFNLINAAINAKIITSKFLASANKLYFGKNHDEIELKKIIEALASSIPQKSESIILSICRYFFLELALTKNQNQFYFDEICQIFVERSANIHDSKNNALTFIQHKLTAQTGKLWLIYCEFALNNSGLNPTILAWEEGINTHLWDAFDFSPHFIFLKRFIDLLGATNTEQALSLAQSIYIRTGMHCLPQIHPNISPLVEKKQRENQLSNLLSNPPLAKTSEIIEKLLTTALPHAPAEVALIKKIIRSCLNGLLNKSKGKKGKNEAIKLLSNPIVQNYYLNEPHAFIDTIKTAFNVSYDGSQNKIDYTFITILIKFINNLQNSPNQINQSQFDRACLKLLQTILKKETSDNKKNNIEARLSDVILQCCKIIDAIQNPNMAFWQSIMKAASDSASISIINEIWKKSHTLKPSMPQDSDWNYALIWHAWEIEQQRLLITLFCHANDFSHDCHLLAALYAINNINCPINVQFKQQQFLEKRLCQFLSLVLEQIAKSSHLYPKQILVYPFKDCLHYLKNYLKDKPEIRFRIEMSLLKYLCRSKNPDDFHLACEYFYSILHNSFFIEKLKKEGPKINENVYFQLLSLIQQAFEFDENDFSELIKLLAKLVKDFHLRFTAYDPILSISALCKHPSLKLINIAAELALYRLDKGLFIQSHVDNIKDEAANAFICLIRRLHETFEIEPTNLAVTILNHINFHSQAGYKTKYEITDQCTLQPFALFYTTGPIKEFGKGAQDAWSFINEMQTTYFTKKNPTINPASPHTDVKKWITKSEELDSKLYILIPDIFTIFGGVCLQYLLERFGPPNENFDFKDFTTYFEKIERAFTPKNNGSKLYHFPQDLKPNDQIICIKYLLDLKPVNEFIIGFVLCFTWHRIKKYIRSFPTHKKEIISMIDAFIFNRSFQIPELLSCRYILSKLLVKFASDHSVFLNNQDNETKFKLYFLEPVNNDVKSQKILLELCEQLSRSKSFDNCHVFKIIQHYFVNENLNTLLPKEICRLALIHYKTFPNPSPKYLIKMIYSALACLEQLQEENSRIEWWENILDCCQIGVKDEIIVRDLDRINKDLLQVYLDTLFRPINEGWLKETNIIWGNQAKIFVEALLTFQIPLLKSFNIMSAPNCLTEYTQHFNRMHNLFLQQTNSLEKLFVPIYMDLYDHFYKLTDSIHILSAADQELIILLALECLNMNKHNSKIFNEYKDFFTHINKWLGFISVYLPKDKLISFDKLIVTLLKKEDSTLLSIADKFLKFKLIDIWLNILNQAASEDCRIKYENHLRDESINALNKNFLQQ